MHGIVVVFGVFTAFGGFAHAASFDYAVRSGVAGQHVGDEIVVPGVQGAQFKVPRAERYILWSDYQNSDRTSVLWTASDISNAYQGWKKVIVGEELSNRAWAFNAAGLKRDMNLFPLLSDEPVGDGTEVFSSQTVRAAAVVETGVTTATLIRTYNNRVYSVGSDVFDVIEVSFGWGPVNSNPKSGLAVPGISLVLSGGENWFDTVRGDGPVVRFDALTVGSFEAGSPDFDVSDIRREMAVPGIGDFFEGEYSTEQAAEEDKDPDDWDWRTTPLRPIEYLVWTDAAGNPLPGFGYSFDLGSVTPLPVESSIVYVDPAIAVGYIYELRGNGSFTGFQAPTLDEFLDSDGFALSLLGGTGATVPVLPGEKIDFALLTTEPVTGFRLAGISGGSASDPVIFASGVNVAGADEFTRLFQTPLFPDTGPTVGLSVTKTEVAAVSAVPLPAGLPLMLGGLAVMGGLAMRRKRV